MIPTVNIPNGTYPAVIKDYGIWKNKTTENLSAYIDIEIELGGRPQKLRWFGGLSAQVAPVNNKSPRQWTMETLEKLNPLITLQNLVDKARENIDEHDLVGTDVSVVILNELNQKDKKTVARIKYINPAQSKFKGLSVQELSSLGVTQSKRPPVELATDDDLPF